MELLILTLTASLFVFTLCASVVRVLKRDRLRAEERLGAMFGTGTKDEIRESIKRQRKKAPIKISSVMIDQLASAGVPMRAEEYLLIWACLAFIPPVVAALLGARFFICMVLCAGGLALPPLYVRNSKKKRVRAFEAQLGDALISISNCIKSGLTFQQGMANVAEQMPDPVAREFGRTLREMQLGNSMDEALNNLSRRIPSSDLKLMITAILISQQVGGSLSEVLDSIAQTIVDRLRIKSDIHAITSSGRMSGIIIGCLPIGIGLVLAMINPDYMRVFIETDTGRIMLGVAAGMEVIGFLVIKKMVTVKY